MRLLHARNIELVEFVGDQIPKYAILSHTWGREEVNFECLKIGQYFEKVGYRKVSYACKQAIQDGLCWVWIDTCCIDKTSSAELSEAINSMFRWYQSSEICYAYLEDVDHAVDTVYDKGGSFAKSRWFKRGWTLQELIAPWSMRFYDQDWTMLASRESLSDLVEDVTGIPPDSYNRKSGTYTPNVRSIAQRMSWASDRITTRPEDRAYSLLGLFGVHMPLLYGEGGVAAFQRLQEEIMKVSEDLSILAWREAQAESEGLFARSPDDFRNCGDIISTSQGSSALIRETRLSNVALHVRAQIIEQEASSTGRVYFSMVLRCRRRQDFTKVLGLRLCTLRTEIYGKSGQEIVECECDHQSRERVLWIDSYTAISESREQSIAIMKMGGSLFVKGLYPLGSSCDRVWLRCSESFRTLTTEGPFITRAYPLQYWYPDTWTFNLSEAWTSEEDFVIDQPDGSSLIYGAVALSDPFLYVAFCVRRQVSGDDGIGYTFATPNTKWPPRKPEIRSIIDRANDAVHQLQVNNKVIIELRAHICNICKYRVAILDLDVVEGTKEKIGSQIKATMT